MDDVMLLKIGRHFRVKPDVKVVMGREEGENKFLERYAPGRWRLETQDVTGPTTLVEGHPTDDDLRQIAGMTVRYAGSKADADALVACRYEETERILEPAPVEESVVEEWRI
jgi:predicted ribosome quality control (RQC) complex YloA/Tae2 family protein